MISGLSILSSTSGSGGSFPSLTDTGSVVTSTSQLVVNKDSQNILFQNGAGTQTAGTIGRSSAGGLDISNSLAGNATDISLNGGASAGGIVLAVNNASATNSITLRSATGKTSVHTTNANAAMWIQGNASELLTLSTGGTTTDTAANLLPADAIIEAVVARVTTTITTATDWKLGDATIAGRFSAANSTLVAGTTQVGTVMADQTGTSGPRQVAAAKVRVTTTGTPGAGAIRITVFYRQFVAPTS